jgi:hypothetical protein
MLLRGEHWIQENPVEFHGESVDLRQVSLRGQMAGPLRVQRLNSGHSLTRFRLEIADAQRMNGKGRPFEVECHGFLRDDQRVLFDRLAAGRAELVVQGELCRNNDPNRDRHNRWAFEIRVTQIDIHPSLCSQGPQNH